MPETEVKNELSLAKAQVPSMLQKAPTSFAPRSLDEAITFCKFVANSELAPKDYKGKPENVLIAIQMGAELGLAPMQSIQSISVINGRGAVWGDALLALIQASPNYEWHKEWFEGADKTRVAVCQMKRRGNEVHEVRFGFADAAKADLLGKDIYKKYGDRMFQMRARSFCGRDTFADVLRGIVSVEEAQDYEVIEGGALVEQDRQRSIPSQDPGDVPIGKGEKAMAFYRCWKNSGWTVEQAKAKMKEISGADTSDMIPEKHYAKCMEWAQSKPEPVKQEAPVPTDNAGNPDAEPVEQGQ